MGYVADDTLYTFPLIYRLGDGSLIPRPFALPVFAVANTHLQAIKYWQWDWPGSEAKVRASNSNIVVIV